jgi:antitoxin ParD1/3/4
MAGSVNLGDQLDGVVDTLVKAGRYGSRSEVLREGVRLVQEREAALARFEVEMQKGLDDIAAGRSKPADQVFDRLRRKYEAMAAKSAA